MIGVNRRAACRRPARVLVLVLVAATSGHAQAAPQGSTPHRTATETLLCTIHETDLVEPSCRLSPDDRHVAYRVRAEGKRALLVDGRRGPVFDDVTFPVFSPDGRHLAYLARQGMRRLAVTDTGVVAAFDSSTTVRDLRFTPQGELLYLVDSAGGTSRVVGPHPSPPFKRIDAVLLSRTGQHRAFIASDGTHDVVVADGTPGKAYDTINSLAMSDDGGHVAFLATRGGKAIVVLDGQERPSDERVVRLVLSPDGGRTALVTAGSEGQRVVLDGRPGPFYGRVDDVLFSADGRRCAYAAVHKGTGEEDLGSVLVHDGREEKPYVVIVDGTLTFSPDGSHIAYEAGANDRFFTVLDDAEGPPFDDILNGSIVFAPDGRRVAYIGQRGDRRYVVANGEEGEPWENASGLEYAPDGSALVCVAESQNKRFVVVNQTRGPSFDEILSERAAFDAADRFHYIARRGAAVLLVEESLH